MRIGILSDIHYTVANRKECRKRLETVVSDLDDVDLVVLLGDLITDVSPKIDADLLSDIAEIMEAIQPPVRAVLGHHDVRNQRPKEAASFFSHGVYGRQTVQGQDLIFLDSSAPDVEGRRGAISDEQLSFLRDTLAAVGDALVFVHHPIHYQDLADNWMFSEHPERAFCGNKKEVNRIINAKGGVRAVFSGHIHEGGHVHYQGIDHVTVPPFADGCPSVDHTVSGRHVVVDVADEEIGVEVRSPDRVLDTHRIDV